MWIYFLLIRIAALFGHKKAQKIVEGQKDVWKQLGEVKFDDSDWLWVHAASVGEFEQARPLIEKVKRDGLYKVIVTFFSPSGYELRKDYELADVVVYLPFATRKRVKRFLDVVEPKKAVFVKYEFWPQYLKQLKKRGVETYSVASIFRKNQFFFKPLGKSYRNLLKCFTKLLVQDEESKVLLQTYGIENVEVVGDPRFNRVMQVVENKREIPIVEEFIRGAEYVIVAGSTWHKDEELLCRYIQDKENVRLVLVPHEIDDKHLHFIFNLFQGKLLRYTDAERFVEKILVIRPQVLLVDTIGMLSSLYQYATVAYIGGGFGVGIHNTLEAAAYGVPVVWGKNYERFREANDLIRLGGGFGVKNYKELKAVLDAQLNSPQAAAEIAKQYVLSEQDATEKIYKIIF